MIMSSIFTTQQGGQHQVRFPQGFQQQQPQTTPQQPFQPVPQQGPFTPGSIPCSPQVPRQGGCFSSPDQVPQPTHEIIPDHPRRSVEQIDLTGENLTEEEYFQLLCTYIVFRLEKTEPRDKYDAGGDRIKSTWARCTRHRPPNVDHAKTVAEIRRLNKKDRHPKKGKYPTLLKKQHSLGTKAQDQLARAQHDLSAEIRDSRFHVLLEQIDWRAKPLAKKHDKKAERRASKSKRESHSKERGEVVSITAYFKLCPKPEQVASELYTRLHLEKHGMQDQRERQEREQQLIQMRARENSIREQRAHEREVRELKIREGKTPEEKIGEEMILDAQRFAQERARVQEQMGLNRGGTNAQQHPSLQRPLGQQAPHVHQAQPQQQWLPEGLQIPQRPPQGFQLNRGQQVPLQQWPPQGVPLRQQPPAGFAHNHSGPQQQWPPQGNQVPPTGPFRQMPPQQSRQRAPVVQVPPPNPQMHGAKPLHRSTTPIIVEYDNDSQSGSSQGSSPTKYSDSIYDTESGDSTFITTPSSTGPTRSGSLKMASGLPEKPRGSTGGAYHPEDMAGIGGRFPKHEHNRERSRGRSRQHSREPKAHVFKKSERKAHVLQSTLEDTLARDEAYRAGFRSGRLDQRDEDRERERLYSAATRHGPPAARSPSRGRYGTRSPSRAAIYERETPWVRRVATSEIGRQWSRERDLHEEFDRFDIGGRRRGGDLPRYDDRDEVYYREQQERRRIALARAEHDDIMRAQDSRRWRDEQPPGTIPFISKPLDARFVRMRDRESEYCP